MRKITFIFLLMLPFIGFAQNEKPAKQHKFGVGLGYNLNSVMGDSIHPIELSFRYRLNDKHTVQLYVPMLFKKNSFRSEEPTQHHIFTTLDVKKSAVGIGIGYDYKVWSYSFVYFSVGARLEYLSYSYDTNISNNHYWYEEYDKNVYLSVDYLSYTKKGNYVGISPNIGLGLRWNNFYVDGRFLLSGLFINRKYSKSDRTYKFLTEHDYGDTLTRDYPTTKSFNIKSSLAVSVSYYFQQ